MKLTPEHLRKFEILLKKCNAEEIRARNYAKQMDAQLRAEYSEGLFDDFEIEAEFLVMSAIHPRSAGKARNGNQS